MNDTEVVVTSYDANYTITKKADPSSGVRPDGVINYTVTVTNTGNVNLTNVKVEDDLTGDTWTIPTLNVNETNVTTFSCTVEELGDDYCDGWINNSVTSTARGPCEDDNPIAKSAYANVSTNFTADFTITKEADPSSDLRPGDVINYTVTVTNTGDVKLNNIYVEDDLTGESWMIPALKVSGKNVTTFEYEVSELSNGICDGWINNTVKATANHTCCYYSVDGSQEIMENYVVSCPPPCVTTTVGPKYAYANVTVYYDARLNITKTANTSGPVGPGSKIKYEIMVCNSGDVNVTDIKVYDDLFDESPFSIPGTLVPGECKNLTDSLIYTVTDDDLCRGWINNSAKAFGIDYCEQPVETETNGTWNVKTGYSAKLDITKTANTSGPVGPGSKIK